MTHLRDEMNHTYASVHINLDRLANDAQLGGGRLRRRKQRVELASGTLAVLAVVGLSAWMAAGPFEVGGGDVIAVAEAPSTSSNLSGMKVLESALAEVVPGATISDRSKLNLYHDKDGHYAKGALTFTPGGATAGGVISLDVSAAPDNTAGFGDCDQYPYPNCQVETLPDGSVLLTHDVPVWSAPDGARIGTSIAGVLVSEGGMVVSLDVRIPLDKAEKHALSPDAPLTTDQLRDVLSQPEWGQLAPLE